ncbi:MAG: hypothetical protein LLG04_15485 [Parachlamydia sp.]|nr:hypothetical protein [Parachlamydia sp.]
MTLLGSTQDALNYPLNLLADGMYAMCRTDTASKIGGNFRRIESGLNLCEQQTIVSRVINIASGLCGINKALNDAIESSAHPIILATTKKVIFRQIWTNESFCQSAENELIALYLNKAILFGSDLTSEFMKNHPEIFQHYCVQVAGEYIQNHPEIFQNDCVRGASEVAKETALSIIAQKLRGRLHELIAAGLLGKSVPPSLPSMDEAAGTRIMREAPKTRERMDVDQENSEGSLDALMNTIQIDARVSSGGNLRPPNLNPRPPNGNPRPPNLNPRPPNLNPRTPNGNPRTPN